MKKKRFNWKNYPNFSRAEFECQCGCGRIGRHPENLARVLTSAEKLRSLAKRSVNITSGYRCPTHNKEVGGVKGSYHTKNMAVDLWVEGYGPGELAYLARKAGFGGRGRYWHKAIVHCDSGPVREWDEYR